jgi:hypothetical protein
MTLFSSARRKIKNIYIFTYAYRHKISGIKKENKNRRSRRRRKKKCILILLLLLLE